MRFYSTSPYSSSVISKFCCGIVFKRYRAIPSVYSTSKCSSCSVISKYCSGIVFKRYRATMREYSTSKIYSSVISEFCTGITFKVIGLRIEFIAPPT